MESRNPDYVKVKGLIKDYFENLNKNAPTENILFDLQNYSIPVNEVIITITEIYLLKIKETKLLSEKKISELYQEIEEKDEKLNEMENKMRNIEKLVKNHPITQLIKILEK